MILYGEAYSQGLLPDMQSREYWQEREHHNISAA